MMFCNDFLSTRLFILERDMGKATTSAGNDFSALMRRINELEDDLGEVQDDSERNEAMLEEVKIRVGKCCREGG